jgi:hypothetical protein
VDARIDLVVIYPLLNKLVCDVVANGEGIKEGTLLKDHAGAGAEMEEFLFAHIGNLFPEQMDAAFIRAKQAVGEFEKDTFSYAGGSQENACLSGRNRASDVF